jgi:hypothetical protein
MKVHFPRSSRNSDNADGPTGPAQRFGLRALTVTAVAVMLLGLGVLTAPSRPARAGDDGKAVAVPVPASQQAFIREMQGTIKAYDDRLVGLAKRVLEEPDSPQSLEDQLLNLRITVKSAEANYLNAKLTREIAEIAIREYTEGVYVQDLQTVEGEITLARNDLERGRDLIEIAKEMQTRIKEVADENTAYGRMINYDLAGRVVHAQLEVLKRKYTLEQAESKKKVLVEFTKEKRTKDLKSEVAKAYSEEVAKKAAWDLMEVKVTKLEKALKNPWPGSSVGKRLLSLLDRASPIEEQVHAKLDQLATDANFDGSLQKEIRNLTNDLGAIIEEAEAARSASDFTRLKSRIQQAARR